jgi:hypothetical protein
MPLSRTDLPRIGRAIQNLIRALEQVAPGKPAHGVTDANNNLLAALMPSGVDTTLGGHTDITESTLEVEDKARLKQLRRYLTDEQSRPIVFRARHEKEETIAYLQNLRRGLGQDGRGKPRTRPGAKEKYPKIMRYVLRKRRRKIPPTRKDMLDQAKARYPDEAKLLPKPTSFWRNVLTRESQATAT